MRNHDCTCVEGFSMKHKALSLPWIILVIFPPFSTFIELSVSGLFYENGHFSENSFFKWIYEWGIFPAWVVVGASLFMLIGWKKIRLASLYLILVLAIGSGLIVHVLL